MSTGTIYDRGNRWTHISADSTVTIASTATRLVRINVNNIEASGLIDVYDGTSVSDLQVASIAAAVNAHTGSLEFNVALSGGLTVDVTNGPDITVIYR